MDLENKAQDCGDCDCGGRCRRRCQLCGGTRKVLVNQDGRQVEMPCPACGGKGSDSLVTK